MISAPRFAPGVSNGPTCGSLPTHERSSGLYGIVNMGSTSYSDPACNQGCDVHRVDVPARVVRSAVRFTGSVGRVVALRYDPFQQRVVLGYLTPGSGYNTFTGYQIISFAP